MAQKKREHRRRTRPEAPRARTNQSIGNASGEISARPTSPYRFYRVNRLAEIFGVCRETIWRWEKNGVLPPFKQIGSLRGLTEDQIAHVLEQRGAQS